MARPRTPVAQARISGQIHNHPSRFKNRADPKAAGPLGEPPDWLAPNARLAWALLAAEMPWLARSDRAITEIAALLRGRMLAGERLGVPSLNLLRLVIAQMGGSPVDKSKIAVQPEPAGDGEQHFRA